MIDATLISKVKSLSPADRIELIGAVWDTLSPADVPLSEAEKNLLDTRLEDLQVNPDEQDNWSAVQERLRQLLP